MLTVVALPYCRLIMQHLPQTGLLIALENDGYICDGFIKYDYLKISAYRGHHLAMVETLVCSHYS
jgi:hypothetical protein